MSSQHWITSYSCDLCGAQPDAYLSREWITMKRINPMSGFSQIPPTSEVSCVLLLQALPAVTHGITKLLLRDQGRCLLSSKPKDSDFLNFNPKIETGISHGNSRDPDFHESRRISRNLKDLQGMCCQLDGWRLRHPAGHWPGMKAWAASLFIYIIACTCVICMSVCAYGDQRSTSSITYHFIF